MVGAGRPASGAVATWARRRSGFFPLACGAMVPVFGSAAAWGAGCHDADAAVEGGDVEGQGERLAHWRPVY